MYGARPRSKPGTDFRSMRQKARAGKLRGDTYREDRFENAPTTHISHGKRDMTTGVRKAPLRNDGTGHDPVKQRYPGAQKIV